MSEPSVIPAAPAAPYHRRTVCQHCGGGLETVLDLGPMAPATFPPPDEPDPPVIPISLLWCEACHFVQLGQIVDDDSLYRQDRYRSGINETMRAELADVVAQARSLLHGTTTKGLTVLDIGANDGTLLSSWGPGVWRGAFEPARNLFDSLKLHANMVCETFFPSVQSKAMPGRTYDAITTIAVFYDLEDPRSCVEEIDRLLTPDGVWVVQFQDLGQQVATTAFDNVCFEHRGNYSLEAFEHLLEGMDLRVVDASHRAINGGSLRLIVRRKHHPENPRVAHLRRWEIPYVSYDALLTFAWRTTQIRDQIQAVVGAAAQSGPVDLYAASTKSSTLLQYCGLDHTIIRQAVERTEEKWGRVTAGTRLPIVSEAQWRQDPAPVTLVGAWQFAEAFCAREAEYLQQGGSFLVPLPTVRLVQQGKRTL